MSGFVADASCVAAWLLEDESSAIADEFFARLVLGEELWAPILLRYEVVNVLTIAFTRRKRITHESLQRKLQKFDQIPFEYCPECNNLLTRSTQAFAIGQKLSIYDAAYLELAARKELPLATLDEDMRVAARTIGVDLA